MQNKVKLQYNSTSVSCDKDSGSTRFKLLIIKLNRFSILLLTNNQLLLNIVYYFNLSNHSRPSINVKPYKSATLIK